MENKTNLQPRVGGGDSGFVVIDTTTQYSRYTPSEIRSLYETVKAATDNKAHTFVSLLATIISFIPGLSVGVSLANNGISALASDTSKAQYIHDSYESIIEALLALQNKPDCDPLFIQEVNTYDDQRRRLKGPLIFTGTVKGHWHN